MKILITGASGFIGRHLVEALLRSGHELVLAARHTPHHLDFAHVSHVHADFTRDLDAAQWLPRLTGVEVVINAVGILREHGDQTFERLHTRAPQALFDACERAGVRRIIQISALGADSQAASAYHLSKRAADDDLSKRALNWTIVQPALVYGRDGTSASLFTLLASLPLIPLPGDGSQRIQPIHIDELVASIVTLVNLADIRRRVPLVGPEPLTYKAFLARLRFGMNLGSARFLKVPMPLMRMGASLASLLPGVLLDRDTLGMLERGNTADVTETRALLGREPRGVEAFIPADEVRSVRLDAQLSWLLPLLRYTLAFMWIWTGVVSFGLYPAQESYALLARVGANGTVASLLLYDAAALDMAFGLGILLLRRRYWLWVAQLVLIVLYTLIITLKLPEFWLHPYGPVLKNLPVLAGILLLQQLERVSGIRCR